MYIGNTYLVWPNMLAMVLIILVLWLHSAKWYLIEKFNFYKNFYRQKNMFLFIVFLFLFIHTYKIDFALHSTYLS